MRSAGETACRPEPRKARCAKEKALRARTARIVVLLESEVFVAESVVTIAW